MSTKIFNLGAVQIEALINGTGEIIILLPGGGGEASSFNSFTPLLNKAGYKTVAINRRGIGGSKGPLENLTLHDLANDIADVIRKLGKNPVHVLGWAFGNRVARCVAEDHPNLVKTVILIAAGGKVPPDPKILKTFAKIPDRNYSGEERLEAVKLTLFSPSTDMDTIIQKLRGQKSWPEAAKAHSKASQVTPILEWWNGGHAPMLVIQGLDDVMAVPENGHILKRENSDRVKLVNIENVGHLMIHEQPNKIADEIISFLSEFRIEI